ncbi:MAG: SpaH/EbpB family LPXTG-anchored major pilin [Propionibacteriaceae bacterium]|jgi:fimbrial isopeptide formation D2 family protein|nr:SpaH/EbpB family LPXTG-anchored major pilin [Propionibacteriaceae bacterium]
MNLKSLAASAAAITLLLGATLSTGAQAAGSSTIDGSKTATIYIEKHKSPAGEPGDGKELSQAEKDKLAAPLPGAQFQATLVESFTNSAGTVRNLDLTTNDGWLAATEFSDVWKAVLETTGVSKDANAFANSTNATLGATSKSGETDANGQTQISNLKLGLYYVEEIKTPKNAVASAPFLVTLPYSDPDDAASWLTDNNGYAVWIYPKNSTYEVGKTVDDEDAVKIGDTVSYTITVDIPKEEKFKAFHISDTLDERLEYVDGSLEVSAISEDSTVATVPTSDYKLTKENKVAGAKQNIKIAWEGQGLIDLVDAWKGNIKGQKAMNKITVTFKAKIVAKGEIKNSAEVYVNDPDQQYDPGSTTPEPTTTVYGDIAIHKADAKDATKLLAGAQFKIYTNLADAKDAKNAIKDPADNNKDWTVTTDSNGVATFEGIRFNIDGAKDQAGMQKYYVVEVKAPSEYQLLAEPVEVQLVENDLQSPYVHNITIQNVNKSDLNGGNPFVLTGGAGRTAVYLGGALLIAAAAVLAVRRRVRQH